MAYKVFSEGKDSGWGHVYYKIEYETTRLYENIGVRYRISYNIDRNYWFGYNIYANVWTEGQNFGRQIKANSPSSGGNTLLFPENGDFYWFNKGYADNNINNCRVIINSTNGGTVPFDTGSDRTLVAPTGFLASSISSSIDFNVGEDLKININDVTNINYTYNLNFYCLKDSSQWQKVAELNTNSKNFTWNLKSNSNTLYGLIKNRKNSRIRIDLTTYYGGTTIGQTSKEGTTYIVNSDPDVPTVTIDSFYDYAIALPANVNTTSTIPTNNPSKLSIIINKESLVAKNQATLKRILVSYINGQKIYDLPEEITENISIPIYYINTDDLKDKLKNLTDTIKVTVVDSRGNSAEKDLVFQVIPYDLPEITSVTLKRKNMIDSQVYLSLTGEVNYGIGLDWRYESQRKVVVKIATKNWNNMENTGTVYEQEIPASDIVIDTYGYDDEDPSTWTRRRFSISNFQCIGDLGAQGFSTDTVFYAWIYAEGDLINYTYLMDKVFSNYSVFPKIEKGRCLFDITSTGVSFGDLYNTSVGGPLQVNGQPIGSAKTNIITGQEVTTNEYIDGKQVYVKRISFTMSNTINAWQTVDTISNMSEIINTYGILKTSGGEIIPFPTAQTSSEIVKVYIASQNGRVNVYHSYTYANNASCHLNIYYTKN